ncbi:MAG TPA: MBL fold metallo-hydrolase [Gemmatimonadaceae bacterium]|jgi:glyoxylase-like metal-dependent hydrolase (beta-lactamase superfamily II)
MTPRSKNQTHPHSRRSTIIVTSRWHQPLHAFFERPYPSANAILLHGPASVLVDPGFGSDIIDLETWLTNGGVPPDQLALVVNTHYHSDHVGGNHVLQQQYGVAVAAHAHDADMINRRDPNACAAEWLRQPVESYTVDRSLTEGDTIDTGAAVWQVLHTPGHTVGHISLFEPTSGVLIVGDAVHAADVGWLNPVLEGAHSLTRSLETIERLQALEPRLALSGHGAAIVDPASAFRTGRGRFERWLSDPEGMAWHAAKRILAYALMIEGGMDADDVAPYLEASQWVHDFAKSPFATTPANFAELLLQELLRSRGARWESDRLVATAPHTPTDPSWPRSAVSPSDWQTRSPEEESRRATDRRRSS